MSPEAAVASGAVAAIPPYASTKLIAYIGNKRALLPYLRATFDELGAESPISSFLDPFAGSGSVSRLARSMGFRVMASDAEEYSRAVNECWLGVSADEGPALFAREGGIAEVLRRINRFHPEREDELPPGGEPEPYIARHYAPANTGKADWRRERLFYTRENAVFLDRARSYVEAIRPRRSTGAAAAERAILLGCLVYEAATHANTSGLFKACHKGFGGHGRDALGRIMAPMELEPPLLWPGPAAEVGRDDAVGFCASRNADLCYLDPPYNQHQYGSNYHLLNTIARWDRLPVSEEREPSGELAEKAGIPPSWKESRSAFCSRKTAPAAFRELLAAVDARFVLLSYNSEGIVPPEELYDLLADRAEVELRSVDYVKFRGGRQSASRRVRNRELLFVARRREGRPLSAGPARHSKLEALGALEADLRLARALSSAFDPARLQAIAGGSGEVAARFALGGRELVLPCYRFLLFEREAEAACASLSSAEKLELAALLEPVSLGDNRAACEACLGLLESGCAEGRLQGLALNRLRKIAHRRYGEAFEACAARMEAVAARGGLPRLERGAAELRALYAARLAGTSSRSRFTR
jgi:adenine-specific DNA-methyltransferase